MFCLFPPLKKVITIFLTILMFFLELQVIYQYSSFYDFPDINSELRDMNYMNSQFWDDISQFISCKS